MKPITINVSETVYRDFQSFAKQQDRKTAELIREAMAQYRDGTIRSSVRQGLEDLRPLSVGKVLRPFTGDEDLLDEMTSA